MALQYQFTAHIRAPAQAAAPVGVAERGLAVYRELMYANVEGFMARAFPVLRSLIDDTRWHAMVRDYFARHRARSALFPRMAEEFLRYLADERDAGADPPFLRELAHYEWLEADVLFDPCELSEAEVDEEIDLLDGFAVPNPVLRPAVYRFPVQRIGPALQPQTPPIQPTYLVVYRRRDDSAGFMELNAVSARLLELILKRPTTSLRELLHSIARELAHPDAQTVLSSGRVILEMFLDKQIILGTRKL